jgi:hypothetical protein
VSEDALPFGRQAVATTSAVELLALERSAGLTRKFEPLDDLVSDALRRLLHGERIVEVRRERRDAVTLLGLDGGQDALIDELFTLEHQQARGAWFLPEEASLRAGLLNLPFYFRQYPRFATGLALEERARVHLHDSAELVLIWAVLEPLVEQLFLPFELRGPQAGLKSREEQRAAWASFDAFTAALGFDVSDELAVMRYGGGWSRLRSAEQVEAKQRLLAALARQVNATTASRYRAAALHMLIGQYYDKATKRAPTRRQAVSNRALQRILAGYFGGDWLAFLAYIDEAPHPDERIATALPETRLQVGTAARADEVAAELGLPAAEVERMLAAYWDRPTSLSPIEERVEVLRRYWQTFDDIHARQASGMRPLWGLVEDVPFTLADDSVATIPYQDGLYRDLLPADLLADIERLWGAVMLPRWPEGIVTQPSPHLALAETFGPALKFWHGCALTAWFICEGPYSRTDLAGMAHYYRDEVAQLTDLGCPVNEALFTDLVRAEEHLGPPEPISSHSSTQEVVAGVSITMQMNQGERRRGFERLRDIVTRHRRAWAVEHVERYLRARWESELRAVEREYNRLIEDKGKPPTPKQFAGRAATATNHWFGGDISALYGALGEKIRLRPEHVALMPADRVTFAWSVFRELGGTVFHRKTFVATAEEADEQNKRSQAYSNLKRLAEQSLWYVQLTEALGRPPQLPEFGRNKFQWLAPTVNSDIDEAWKQYCRAVEATLHRQPSTPPAPVLAETDVPHPSHDQTAAESRSPTPQPRVEPAMATGPTSGRPWWKRLLGR